MSKIDPTMVRLMPPLEGAAQRLSRWMEGAIAYFQVGRARGHRQAW